MRSDLDDQLVRLGDWMEDATGQQLRPDLADVVVSVGTVETRAHRRLVAVAAAVVAFVAGGLAVLLLAGRGTGPTAVVTPQTEVTTTVAPPSSTTVPTSTTTTEAPLAIDVEVVHHVAEAFMAQLDGSESGWSVVVLDTATGDELVRAGDDQLVASTGSAIHVVPVAAAVAAGYDDGRDVDGTGPCDGPNGEIRNFGNGGGGVGTLESQVTRASRCAMTSLDQVLRPSWILARAGLPHTDDLIGDRQLLEVAELAELVRALTGDGVFQRSDGPVRLVSAETAEIVRSYYEANVRGGTATRMLPASGESAAGVTGTNEDMVHSVAVLRTGDVVIAVVIEDPDGANSGRNLTGGSFPAMLAQEIHHAAVVVPRADVPASPQIVGTVDAVELPRIRSCPSVLIGRGDTSIHATPRAAFRALFADPALPLSRVDHLAVVVDDELVVHVPEPGDHERPSQLVRVVLVDGGWQVDRWELVDC